MFKRKSKTPVLVTRPASAAALSLLGEAAVVVSFVERLAVTEAARVDGLTIAAWIYDPQGKMWIERASLAAVQARQAQQQQPPTPDAT